MFDLENLRLLHRHGDDWSEIHATEHHDAAAHDTERALLKGARVYRCVGCEEEWIITPGGSGQADTPQPR
jgi:hypothetical protein